MGIPGLHTHEINQNVFLQKKTKNVDHFNKWKENAWSKNTIL